jgi:hypothetical protein
VGTHAFYGQIPEADTVNLVTDLAAKADAAATTSALAGKQGTSAALDDLSAITGAAGDDAIQYKSGHWVKRTLTQLKADLALAASDIVSGTLAIARIPTGTTGTTVPLGNDGRFSDSRAPNGSAGGSLAGSYPNPTIAASAITGTEIAASIKDPAAATAGLRTLGTGSAQALPGDHASTTNSRAPNGSAGGVLGGTYPSPSFASGDITAFAAISSATAGALVTDGSGWIRKTYAQLKTALGLVASDVGLGSVDNTSNATERAATRTLTNARITKRIGTTASSSTPTADADAHDAYHVTAAAANMTVGSPTGTPTDEQMLMYRFKDNGTARTIAWNAVFRAMGVTLPTTTVISKTLYVGTVWNAADSKWDVIATGQEA